MLDEIATKPKPVSETKIEEWAVPGESFDPLRAIKQGMPIEYRIDTTQMPVGFWANLFAYLNRKNDVKKMLEELEEKHKKQMDNLIALYGKKIAQNCAEGKHVGFNWESSRNVNIYKKGKNHKNDIPTYALEVYRGTCKHCGVPVIHQNRVGDV